MNIILIKILKHKKVAISFIATILLVTSPATAQEKKDSIKSDIPNWICIGSPPDGGAYSYSGPDNICIMDTNSWLIINRSDSAIQYFCFEDCFVKGDTITRNECVQNKIKKILKTQCPETKYKNGKQVCTNKFGTQRKIKTGKNSYAETRQEMYAYLKKFSKCPVPKDPKQCIIMETLKMNTQQQLEPGSDSASTSPTKESSEQKDGAFWFKNFKKLAATILLAQEDKQTNQNQKTNQSKNVGLYSCAGNISSIAQQAIDETQGFDPPQPPASTGSPATVPIPPTGQAGTGAGPAGAGNEGGNGSAGTDAAIRDILGNGGKEGTTQAQGHAQGTGDKQGDTGNGTAGTSFGGPAGKTPPSNPGGPAGTTPPPPPPADKPDTKKPDVKTPEEKNQNGLLAYLKDKNEQLFGKTNSETETKNTQNTQNSDGGLLSSIFGNTFAYLAQNQNSQNNYEYAREKKFEKVSYADKKTATSSDLWKALFGDRIQDSVKERELQKATKLEEKFKHEMETQGEILKSLPKVELKDDKLVLTNDKPQKPEDFLGFLKDKEKLEKRLEQIAESAGFKYLYYKQNEVEVYDQNGEKIVQIKVKNGKKRVGLAKEDGTVVFVPEGGILDDKNSWQAFTDAFVQIAGRLPQTEVQGPNTKTKIYPYEIALKELYGAEAIEDGISLDPENPFMTVGKDGIKIPLFVLEAAQEKAEQVRGILNLKQEIKQISNGHVNIIKTSEFLSQAEIDIDDIKKIKIPTVSQNALYFAKLKKELIKRGHVNITEKINLAILNSYNLALKKTTGVVAYTIRVDQNGNPIENSTKKYFALADVVSSFFAEATSIFDNENQNPLLKILSLFVPPTKDAPENRVIRVDDLPTNQPQNITDAIAKVIIKPIVWIKNLLFGL